MSNDLIPVEGLRRLADLYASGAGPISRVYASLFRHLIAWREGDRSEDHVAAVAWNGFTLMSYEEQIKQGNLPDNLIPTPAFPLVRAVLTPGETPA